MTETETLITLKYGNPAPTNSFVNRLPDSIINIIFTELRSILKVNHPDSSKIPPLLSLNPRMCILCYLNISTIFPLLSEFIMSKLMEYHNEE